jgi:hypothetical protein
MTDQQNPLDEVDRIYTSPDPSIDFVRLQIGFWEKLIVLDAATLAASFTAIGMFRDHLVGDGGGGYLQAAWKLLFCGIALCLLAQWLAIPGAIAISGHYYAMRVLALLQRSSRQQESEQDTQRRLQYEPIQSAIVAESPWLSSKAKYISRVAGGLGSLGLLSSICAFYWLYRFAQVNLSRPGR